MGKDGPSRGPDIARVSESPPTAAGAVRVFIGIKLAPEIARELAKIASELENSHVKPVIADDMHLTLVPPWQEDSIGKATETLRQLTSGFVAFALDVQHVGYGPDLRRPRMLWADYASTGELVAYASTGELVALRAALLAAYTQTDERPFRPHVTLARLRGNGRAIARENNPSIEQSHSGNGWTQSNSSNRPPQVRRLSDSRFSAAGRCLGAKIRSLARRAPA
jgi:2'-5' RNA ligase